MAGIRAIGLALGLAGCSGGGGDPMPAARAELAADLADGQIEAEGTVVTFAGDRITVDGPEPGLACPVGALLAGLFASAMIARQTPRASLRSPAAWAAAVVFIGGPVPAALAVGLWATYATDLDVDLAGRTVTRTTRWRVGPVRVETVPLAGLKCAVNTREDEDRRVTGCDVTLSDPAEWRHWRLLPEVDCPRAHAVCEHVTRNLRATTPIEASP